MIRRLALAVALLTFFAASASAGQIDVVLKYTSAAAAKADPVVQQHYDAVADLFNDSHVITNLQVWRASQDVAGTDAKGNPTVTHTFLSGFYLLISVDHVIAALRDDAAVQVAIDRDKANAGQVGAVLKSTVSQVVLNDLRFQPVFAGSNFPWGNWQ